MLHQEFDGPDFVSVLRRLLTDDGLKLTDEVLWRDRHDLVCLSLGEIVDVSPDAGVVGEVVSLFVDAVVGVACGYRRAGCVEVEDVLFCEASLTDR